MILRRDDTFRVVLNLRTPQNGKEKIGTGIFVSKNSTEPYIVTATHVAKSCGADSKVVLSDQAGKSLELALVAFSPKLAWRHHPVADISVLPLTMTPAIEAHMTKRFFPLDHFHLQKTPVSRDFELTSVGFPHGLGAQGLFSPLTYRSYASSALITLLRSDTHTPCEFFCLENPSVGGYSGCPIFDLAYMVVGGMTSTREKTLCVGIMHGTISDDTGGKLSAVTPAYYLDGFI
ncbi:MAG: trypsin-like peptidase domain-containing protein [Armatimonadetes bacterium]|nr:trypsin-like peptidase domain-containing protein [Armatimonadota bacterium]